MNTLHSSEDPAVQSQGILEFLTDRSSYPHQPESLELIQTHSSYVVIVPPRVYKVKKPVNFGFLDYSTPEKRRHYCEQEIELNSRLCGAIYREVVPIRLVGGCLTFGDEGEIVDYALVMDQLESGNFLIDKSREGTLDQEDIDRTADKLAEFYKSQRSTPETAEWGKIERLKISTDENFEQTVDYIGELVTQQAWEAIREYANGFFEQHKELFERRRQEGRIVDGHGDLHLDHVHVTPERVCIYDCIEFNDRFRYVDVANDIAFFSMDLDFNGFQRLSHWLEERMKNDLDDQDLCRIIDFYKCYRAFVRGKVRGMEVDETEIPDKERRSAADQASRYFNLSLRYALIGTRPTAIVLMGRIGTGKSTLGCRIADHLGINIYASDNIRKELAGLPLDEMSPEDLKEELYSNYMSDKTYAALYDRASVQLQMGRSVVLDATFSRRRKRQELIDMFNRLGVDYCFIETQTSDETIKGRLRARDEDENVVSDARLENFETLNRIYEPPRDLNGTHLMKVNTEQPRDDSLRQIFMQLVERHLQII